MDDNKDDLVPPPLGARVRQLRLARGWSLAELARRMRSSPAALHRYESGWERFELATLRRLAAALEVRLEIRLCEAGAPESGQTAPLTTQGRPRGAIVRHLAPLFWDHRLLVDDLARYPAWICARVLMYGTHAQARAARRWFGDDTVRQAIERREVDARTRNFWRTILGTRPVAGCRERR